MSEDLSTTDDGRTEITITVPADEVEAELNAAYRKLVRGVTIPGFRKGKAPRGIFERHYGVAPLYEEALPVILPRAFETAAVKAGLDPVGSPEYDVKELAPQSPLTFTATVSPRPTVDLDEAFRSIEIPFEPVEVTDEDVEEQIEAVRRWAGELIPVEDESARITDGHAAVVDYTITVPGRDPEEAEEALLELDDQSLLPEFRENLLGEGVGSVLEFSFKVPEGSDGEASGKQAGARVLVKEIKARELPELDDEFAAEHGGVDSMDEMRTSIRESIHKSRTADAIREFERKVLDALVEKVSGIEDDALEPLVKDESVLLARNMSRGMIDHPDLPAESRDKMLEAVKEQAAARVKEKLALEAVARVEDLAVEDGDWSDAVDQVLGEIGPEQRDEVQRDLETGFARRALERSIVRRRALRAVAERASAEYAEVRGSLDD